MQAVRPLVPPSLPRDGGHSIAAELAPSLVRPIDKEEEDARGDSRQKEERTDGQSERGREGGTDDL